MTCKMFSEEELSQSGQKKKNNKSIGINLFIQTYRTVWNMKPKQ